MRLVLILLALLAVPLPAFAEPTFLPARDGNAQAPVLVVYSSLDEPLARPMIRGFQEANPDVAVRYDEMLTGEVHDRIVRETDAGEKTADFAFSSA
ncbi:MAG: ABC transporter substrate-binding protein, partial [Shinella sp.]